MRRTVRRTYVAAYLWLCGRVVVLGPGGWRYRRQYRRRPLPRGARWAMHASGVVAATCTAAYYLLEDLGPPRWVTTATGMLGVAGFYVWVGLGVYGRGRGEEIRG